MGLGTGSSRSSLKGASWKRQVSTAACIRVESLPQAPTETPMYLSMCAKYSTTMLSPIPDRGSFRPTMISRRQTSRRVGAINNLDGLSFSDHILLLNSAFEWGPRVNRPDWQRRAGLRDMLKLSFYNFNNWLAINNSVFPRYILILPKIGSHRVEFFFCFMFNLVESLEAPDLTILTFHLAICNILHATRMRTDIDKCFDELEEIDCFAQDRSTDVEAAIASNIGIVRCLLLLTKLLRQVQIPAGVAFCCVSPPHTPPCLPLGSPWGKSTLLLS